MDTIYLSVVIPSYDEMANLQKGVLEKIDRFLSKKSYSFEVIIVDDGSKDGSIEFVEDFIKDHSQFTVIKNPHFGKAGAVTTGMLKAKGKYRLFTDMDQATPIEELDTVLPFLENEQFDLVIGSRKNQRKGAPLIRLFVSRSNIVLRKLIVGILDISDTQCGFKIFKDSVASDIFETFRKIKKGFIATNGAAVTSGFDVELLYIAEKKGYKIKEVPVKWLYVESRRVNPITDSVKGLIDLLLIRLNILKGIYTT